MSDLPKNAKIIPSEPCMHCGRFPLLENSEVRGFKEKIVLCEYCYANYVARLEYEGVPIDVMIEFMKKVRKNIKG